MKIDNSPFRVVGLLHTIRSMFAHHEYGRSTVFFVATILLLSILTSINFEQDIPFFLAGEVATQNVEADRDLIIEDVAKTRAKQEQAKAMQPLIFDLDKESATRVRDDMMLFLHNLNIKSLEEDGLEIILSEFNILNGTNFPLTYMEALASAEAQKYAMEDLLPWLDSYLIAGILPDMRQLPNMQSSIIVRDVDTGSETLVSQISGLLDIRTLTVALEQEVNEDRNLTAQTKAAFIEIFPILILPTLALNQDAFQQRSEQLLQSIKPVFYTVQKGEIIIREGDVVTLENQLKMQSLLQGPSGIFQFLPALGTFIIALFISLGFFITPSGVRGSILHTKDQIFIALLLLIMVLLALSMSHAASLVSGVTGQNILAFSFPIAGAAGLSVQIFSARRYCVTGLLLSFFTSIIFDGGIALFSFYFLSAMVSTWLVLRAQSRQDVIWTLLPLVIWLSLTGFGVFLFEQIQFIYIPAVIFAIFGNAILSACILFAFSPILEMALGYLTRFRLMELLSLDHPLLQELMMTMPGTYHHSLVAANLVEAGAKAVGANSLLAKVGALYHDIGKLARPEYFTENQFGGPNPHDKLSPTMSSLILFSHVKYGVELAQEYKLGEEISSIIQEHHGTRVPSYFFNKAVEKGDTINEDDFRYPGPRPQSRESAILMMADSIEASSRSMGVPSPARIHSHVEAIVKGIYEEKQLDETDLTFKDLNILIESFVRTLTGLFHQRIVYPEKKKLDEKLDDEKINSEKLDDEKLVNSKEVIDTEGKINSKKSPTPTQND